MGSHRVLSPTVVHDIEALLKQPNATYASVAAAASVSKTTVKRVAKKNYPAEWARDVIYAKCQSCGHRVSLPCRICAARNPKE